jgi:glycosyltransferase involved in cell wall biosynthesis
MENRNLQIKVCLISCVEQVQNIRTNRTLRTIASMGYTVMAIMPGVLPDGQNYAITHFPLPAPPANFWYNGGLRNALRAMYYRLRNSWLLVLRLGMIRPHIIICREPDAWLVALFAKLRFKCKVVADLHEIYDDRALAFPKILQGFIRGVLRALMRWLSRFTDEIIHVSIERQQVYSYLRKPGVVIRQYPEIHLFPPPVFDRKPTLGSSTITVIHAGPLRFTYASEQLLEAMVLVAEELPSVKFVVLGGIAGKIGNIEIAKSLSSRRVLDIQGSVPFAEVIRWLYASDIGINLVLPVDTTHRLAAPQKLYEYLAAGLPVVAADVPSIRSVVTKYECGLLVDPFSPREIANGILRLARDKYLRYRMGQNGRLAAEREFNWEKEQIKWFQVLASLR